MFVALSLSLYPDNQVNKMHRSKIPNLRSEFRLYFLSRKRGNRRRLNFLYRKTRKKPNFCFHFLKIDGEEEDEKEKEEVGFGGGGDGCSSSFSIGRSKQ